MYLSTVLAFAGSAGVAVAFPLSSRGVASFAAGSSWDILLNSGGSVGNVKQTVEPKTFQTIDLDLFDTDAATIQALQANKQVICYFSAGSREDWRPDAGDFTTSDTGKGLEGWAGENWLNVKSDNVRKIMAARIKLAASKGCNAVDPDNVDGFDGNQDEFGFDINTYADYVKFLAQEAASNNLAIGLKNAIDLIPKVIDVVQFAVNEQCHQYDGCQGYEPFTAANKAVFNIEYGGNDCSSPSGVKLSTLIKPEDQSLDTLGGACPGQTQASATASGSVPSSTPTASKTTTPAHTTAPSVPLPTVSSAAGYPTHSATESAAQPTPTDSNDDDGNDGGDDDDDDDSTDGDDDSDETDTKHHSGRKHRRDK